MTDQSVRELFEKYKRVGIKKGHELLMAPFVAISFIDALSQKNIKIVGCDTWRYTKIDNWVGIIENVGGGMEVDGYKDLNTQQIAEIMKRFIVSISSNDVDLISLLFDDQEMYSLLIN